MQQLKTKYNEQVRPAMMQQFGYSSVMAVPRIEKIVVNEGLGSAKEDSKAIDKAAKELALITLQKPIVTKAKKSISNFKLRQGMPVGIKVTLRGERMFVFLEKLINIGLPRIRDFKGVNPNAFDGRGNYNLGIKEQLIFPEITYDMVDKVRGMDITIVTTAKTDEEARALLQAMGLPFRK
ncbi:MULTISPECIES: 50S ribosomal protein L5 [Deinococcus]|jgi:large subunit ribosomal protein L5|uniref:Large ribosomal subunit protein uL5 n=9 Tax=Deinococcus TaxID=1298 RepID=A0A0F7JQ94_9DEIO|nr:MULTISPECIES: 50S ribosomal protein L5 [Deinococcus]AKH16630.1 50S ribosomal protein L5 [Deinococcus soli (ex Cha et al. 2016)]ALW89711.1 50S ribosomal protein L5 [Deinococcus actinosclerus]AWT36453.1 50S ribosomal protein L5 [Deinococcus actinosclerus]MDK2013406.1 50S ribosomal protein L5 [Deinococcus sp. 43]MDR6217131.1 large subunit ribosomal protein L5 [Deinococcus soli (ex Cha et al. 2016)]